MRFRSPARQISPCLRSSYCAASDKSNPANSHAKTAYVRYAVRHGRHTRQIRPTRNQNAFRHGLAGIVQRRSDGVLNPTEQSIRKEILSGLLTDKGGAAQISTATRVLAEIIASDVPLLVTFNHAIDGATRRSVQPARARNQDDPVKESSYFLFHKDAVWVF